MNKILLYKIFLVFLAMLILSGGQVQAEDLTFATNVKEEFKQANEYYEQGQYFKSIELYKKIIKSGVNNAYIYFNLGNAYFKNEQIGYAILNYKIAALFQPRNSDIKANLSFALEQTEDPFSTEESVKPMLEIIFFWYFGFNITEIIIMTIISNFVLCLIGAIFLYKRNEIAKTLLIIVSIIVLILLASTILKIYKLQHPSEAVVTKKEAIVKSGNGDSYSTLFTLHEGNILNLTTNKGNWYKFTLSDGRKGWVSSKEISLVKSNRL